MVCFVSTYPLDSDLSGGQRYPVVEKPGLECQHCLVIAATSVTVTALIPLRLAFGDRILYGPSWNELGLNENFIFHGLVCEK